MVVIPCKSGGIGGGIERGGFERRVHQDSRIHDPTRWMATTAVQREESGFEFAGAPVHEQRRSVKDHAGVDVQLVLTATSRIGQLILSKGRKAA